MTSYCSTPIPGDVISKDGFQDRFLEQVVCRVIGDPSGPSDTLRVLRGYNAGPAQVRDAMDEVLVWLTGYTPASLSAILHAQQAGLSLSSYADLVEGWRKAARE
jgi:hypothetical protein